MNKLLTRWSYDLVLLTGDERIAEILDTINDEISVYDTVLDIHDLDEKQADCSFEFNNINCEYDCEVIDSIENQLKQMGVGYELDNHPDCDECGSYYSYDIKIFL